MFFFSPNFVKILSLKSRVIPVILSAKDVCHLAPVFSPLPLDLVDDSRHEIIFALNDRATALAVRVVPEAEDVAVVGQDESVSAACGNGHGLGFCSVAHGQCNGARLD